MPRRRLYRVLRTPLNVTVVAGYAAVAFTGLGLAVWERPWLIGEASPFAMVRWKSGDLLVPVGGGWQRVDSIDGVPVASVVGCAKRLYGADWKMAFVGCFRRITSNAGAHPVFSVTLGLRGGPTATARLTTANRRLALEAEARRTTDDGGPRVWPPCGAAAPTALQPAACGDGPRCLARDAALEDLDVLAFRLETGYAYWGLRGLDPGAELARLRCTIPEAISRDAFGWTVKAAIARLEDPHTDVSLTSLGEPSERALPLRLVLAGERVLAFDGRFPLAETPLLARLDGTPVSAWLDALEPFIPGSTREFRRYRAVQYLQDHLPIARRILGRASAPDAALVLIALDGSSQSQRTLRLQGRALPAAAAPVLQTIAEGTGYLRIESMEDSPAFLASLQHAMDAACELSALVLDLRDNGGGMRKGALALVPYFIPGPRLVNVAALRTDPADDPTTITDSALADHALYPLESRRFSLQEQAAIRSGMGTFQPEWPLSRGRYSQWYFTAVSPRTDAGGCRYGRPTIVLMNIGSFSATEVFLGAVKGLPGVTMMGGRSGGGSGRPREFVLPRSRLTVRMSTTASFLPGGGLYQGRGVEPDVTIAARGDDLARGSDAQLQGALRFLARQAHVSEDRAPR